MQLRRYRISGIVQGVGFRPFIHKLTTKHELSGWILNDSDGVLLEVQGKAKALTSFISDVSLLLPPMARIDSITELMRTESFEAYTGFHIRESVKFEKTNTLIPPDANVCEDCLAELFAKDNHRYRYPFINCTNCGPRYSIIEDMPYDRPKTTMKHFKMCPECHREYTDINDRRYHAQPNACPVCGPSLELTDSKGNIIEVGDIVSFCQQKLLEGKIFAIKSIGGFHLAANAQDSEAVRLLRSKKKRDFKPFAIMVRDIETAGRFAYLCDKEIDLLKSTQRPIVILKKKGGELPECIAPNNPSLGVMLPCAPLHYLLLENENLPVLIMTSGNVSGHPIVYKNNDALEQLKDIADYFVLNDRDICIRVDDSIVRCTDYSPLKNTIISHTRRARGFAPYPVMIHKNVRSVLALGSELKATIALSKESQVFVSQHIGDIKNDTTFKSLMNCSAHLQNLLSIKPEIIACDSHPSFRSTVASQNQNELPVILVQHHHAHMASCMAENRLSEKAIGVVFDGTGYGLDGSIWGGEFLVGDYKDFKRAGTFSPLYLLGGDKAVKEPFRVAIDMLYRTFGSDFVNLPLDVLKSRKPEELHVFFKMAENKINAFKTSSMGRLFDGISALLNICQVIEYEAQAAIELEGILNKNFDLMEAFEYTITDHDDISEVDYRPIVKAIVNSILSGNQDSEALSRRFHSTVVDIVVKMCEKLRDKYSVNDVVLSGGVFMNEYLLANSVLLLRESGFNVYYHSAVPTNDGGLSLGQIMIADARYDK